MQVFRVFNGYVRCVIFFGALFSEAFLTGHLRERKNRASVILISTYRLPYPAALIFACFKMTHPT